MSANPVPFLAIIALYIALYMVIAPAFEDAEPVNDLDLDVQPTQEQPDSGFFDILAGIIDGIWTFITLLIRALLFVVPGVPPFIQFPIAATLNGSLGWSIASLIRGR